MRTVALAFFLGLTLCVGFQAPSSGHEGRRFELSVVEHQLVAQGVNTGADDGAPAVRPYTNAIHDHWQNSPLGIDSALATLPGFDVPSPSALLVGQPLYLTLENVERWASPPLMPTAGTKVQLSPLPAGEVLEIHAVGQSIDSDTLGTLLLAPSIAAGGEFDLDVSYVINALPSDMIHVLTAKIHSGNVQVQTSDPLYILLSPDGTTPEARLHHASLFLEQALAAANVPEPSTAILFITGILGLGPRRLARRHSS